MSAKSELINVLLVEDSEDDRFFFEHAFQLADCDARLFIAKDGIEGIEFLKNPQLPGRPSPDIMFLDLKMPDCDGFDVLRWMKEHRSPGAGIKVYVLSGSSEPQDVELALRLGAVDYLVKPLRLNRLKQLLLCARDPAGSFKR